MPAGECQMSLHITHDWSIGDKRAVIIAVLRILTIVIICVLFLIGSPVSLLAGPTNPLYGGTLRFPLRFNVASIDPAYARDMSAVLLVQQVFDGLVQYDHSLNIIPAIATSWQISSDGLVYKFFLRQGVRFHNGPEVTAQDFVYSFTRMLDPGVKAQGANLFRIIDGATAFMEGQIGHVAGLQAPDRHTFVIRLRERYIPFLSILATSSAKVVPRDQVERHGREFGKRPIGTGPFRLVEWLPDKIVLEANPDYYGRRPYLDRLVFALYYGSPTHQILEDFFHGQLDVSPVPTWKRQQLSAGSANHKYLRKTLLSLFFYGLNNDVSPLDHPGVRKAINMAIDRDRYVNVIVAGAHQKAQGIIPPGMLGYTPKIDPPPFDLESARKLISRFRSDYPEISLSFTIYSASVSVEAQNDLTFIKSSLSQIGLDPDVRFVTDWPEFESLLLSRNAAMFRYVWYADFADPDAFLYPLFHSKGAYNFFSYRNGLLDSLLDEGREQPSLAKRLLIYRRAQEIILKDLPLVNVCHYRLEQIQQRYVHGLKLNSLGPGYLSFRDVWLAK